MIDILGKRYWLFALSTIIIIPGLLILAFGGLPLSIDFTGGTLLEVKFESASPAPAQVLALFQALDLTDVTVQTTDIDTFIIRSSFLDEESREKAITQLEAEFGETTLLRYDSVGPAIGEQVTQRAALAVGVAALAVIVYIIFAFRGIQHAERYGLMAILAMIHDVAVVFSVAGIGSVFFGWEMDALFLTALLTVIGFSVQDKIVVFDRIRENANILRRLPYETLVNHSIVQTLQRSINTQLMTVEFLLLALALFGGVTLQQFAVILLVGLLSGTYSSIFIAAPLLVVWENREWRTWFGRSETPA
jgi:preprotein translocase subunit SecF